MTSSEIFISIMFILLIFNVFYTFYNPAVVWDLTVGAISGFLVVILGTGIISGITVLGSGLSTQSIKIMFGCGTLLNILFQIEIGGFPVGFGLVTNVLNVFGSEILGLGVIIVSILGLLAFVSGIMIITGGE